MLKFRWLPPVFLLLIIFIAGCPFTSSLKPSSSAAFTDTPLPPEECEGCACLVCQRPEMTDLAAIEGEPTGVSTTFLAKSGGGLMGSRCWFTVCGAKLKQQIEEDHSIYQVPFKIGVGQ